MVKKTYVAPSSNVASAKLRTGLLAGSLQAFNPGQTSGNVGVNTDQKAPTDGSGLIQDARRRSSASLD